MATSRFVNLIGSEDGISAPSALTSGQVPVATGASTLTSNNGLQYTPSSKSLVVGGGTGTVAEAAYWPATVLIAEPDQTNYSLVIANRTFSPLLHTGLSFGVNDDGTAFIVNPNAPLEFNAPSTVFSGSVEATDFIIDNGKAFKTDTTTAHTGLLQAYDVDGAAYKTFGTLTNANTPSFDLSAPAGGSLTGNFTTLQVGSVAVATASSSTAFTNKTGNISQWANNSGYGVPLTGITASIGGGLLAGAGSTVTGTVSVTGAVVGHPVMVSASDGTAPNGLVVLSASVTSTDTVTVQLSALAAVTPTAKQYNVVTLA